MSDVILRDSKTGPNPLYLRESEIIAGIELLFFAYRDFTGDPDQILARYGFGRAHHRVIHFVGRRPGLAVAELLAILRITKQSLSRVLKQLVHENIIDQRQGDRDRRQRLLFLTDRGRQLWDELIALQKARVARAYREAGQEAVAGYRRVLAGLINEDERAEILRAVEQPEG